MAKVPPQMDDFGYKVEHKILRCVNDLHFLEHDAYFLFDSIMTNMWEWYYVRENNGISSRRVARQGKGGNTIITDADKRLFSDVHYFPEGTYYN